MTRKSRLREGSNSTYNKANCFFLNIKVKEVTCMKLGMILTFCQALKLTETAASQRGQQRDNTENGRVSDSWNGWLFCPS